MQRTAVPACLGLLLLLLAAISSVAAIENYNVYVQQGTGDWSFITFYPLRLVLRPNDTVTFIQSYDVGIVALPAPGVSTSLLTPVALDPAWTYLNQLSVPTDDPDVGVSVVESATVSYSAGALYAPDIIARLDPQGSLGLRSNWTFEFPIEGVFKFHELYQEMTIEIYVTTLVSQQPLPATTVEQFVQKQQSDDRNRIPCLLDKYVTPHLVPSRDADGRWVVYTGFLENATSSAVCAPVGVPPTGFGVYNRFMPGPTLSIGEGDIVYFVNEGAHPHAVAFNRSGDFFRPQLPLVYDTTQKTYKYISTYNAPSFPDKDGNIVFNGDNFVTLGTYSLSSKGLPIKFTKQGIYSYVCILHVELGMEAVVTVGPRGSGAAPAAAPLAALLATAALAVAALL